MVQENGPERRASERFAMDFKVSVHEIRDGSRSFLEDSVLRDVSGVGIGFLTHRPETYHVGQRLHVTIILPGTDRLEARLEGDATVVRVAQDTEKGMFVGVSMDDPLDFIAGMHRMSAQNDPGRDA
jgi:hypothetical protein